MPTGPGSTGPGIELTLEAAPTSATGPGVELNFVTATSDPDSSFSASYDLVVVYAAESFSTAQLTTTAETVVERTVTAETSTTNVSTQASTFITHIVSAETTLALSASSILYNSSLTLYGAANHQEDNASNPQGGIIDTSKKLLLTPMPTASTITLVSSSQSDTDQAYLVEGLSPGRVSQSELVQLNGVTPVTTSRTFNKIYRVTKQSGSGLFGNVTVSSNVDLGTLTYESIVDPEVTELIDFFSNIYGKASSETTYYEKFFIKNWMGIDLNNITISEYQSDANDAIQFAVSSGTDIVGSTSTSENRVTAPNVTFFEKSATLATIPHDAEIAVWVKLTLAAGESINRNGWKIKVSSDEYNEIFDIIHPESPGSSYRDIVSQRNNHQIGGGTPIQFIELTGGVLVPQSFYEPDPSTYRYQFYYNARLNRLFKKLSTTPVPVWKAVR